MGRWDWSAWSALASRFGMVCVASMITNVWKMEWQIGQQAIDCRVGIGVCSLHRLWMAGAFWIEGDCDV